MSRTLAIALLLAGCGGEASKCQEITPDSPSFIAFEGCFEDFRTWPSFHHDLEDPDLAVTNPAVNGPRTQYINALPPTGSTEFPLGTMIVEARESGVMPNFVAIKRGGDFNDTGAKNWEWAEISEDPIVIMWRGYGPPTGDSYGGDIHTCNNCHKACGADNDFVCSPFLQLSSF